MKNKLVYVLTLLSVLGMASCSSQTAINAANNYDIPAKPAQNTQKSIVMDEIGDTTVLYDYLQISSIYGLYNEKHYPVTANLVSPSGVVFSGNKNVFIDEKGIYTLDVTCDIEGETIRASKVIDASIYSGKTLFSYKNSSFASDEVDYSHNIVVGSVNKGTKLHLSPNNSRITYRKIINLNDVQGNLIEFCGNPNYDAIGIRHIIINIADVYDSSRQFDVILEINDSVNYPGHLNHGEVNTFATVDYADVAFGDNTNFPNLKGKTVLWDQAIWTTYSEDPSISGRYAPMSFKFDCETNSIKASAFVSNWNDPSKDFLIRDLDDPADDYKDFPGFTTGEVYVSIVGYGSTGDIVVGKIGNDILSDLDESLFEESTGELLTKSYNFDNMIQGAVGYHYPLPDISFSNGEVKSSISYKNGDNYEEIQVEDFNDFRPQRSGNYRISLQAKNYFNKIISVTGDFVVNDKPIGFIDVSGFSCSTKIFDSNIVPTFSYAGGNGKITKKVELVVGDEVKEVKEGDSFTIEKKVSNNYFRVTVSDEINNVQVFDNYNIDVDYNVIKFDFVDAFEHMSVIKGNTFTIPDYVAIDYSKSDVSRTNIPIVIKQGKTKTFSPGDKLEINSDTNLTFNYGTEVLKTLYIHSLPYDLSLDKASEEYVGKQFSASSNVSDITVASSGINFFAGENSSMEIYNPFPVSTTNLTISFNVFEDLASYNDLTIELISYNGNSIELTFKDVATSNPILLVNGVESLYRIHNERNVYSATDEISFAGKIYYTYDFVIDSGNKGVFSSKGVLLSELSKWKNGSDFSSFSNAGTLIKYKFDNVSRGDSFSLFRISNQLLNRVGLAYGDLASPALGFEGVMNSTSFEKGSLFFVPKAFAYDFFSGPSVVTMSVNDPNGDAIVSRVNSQSIPLTFNDYGSYTITYNFKDARDNSSTSRYILVVRDTTAPTINLQGNYESTYSGSVRIIPASIVDDSDPNPTLHIYVRDENNKRYIVQPEEEVKLDKGNYEIIYYAYDIDGNSAHLSFPIRIK